MADNRFGTLWERARHRWDGQKKREREKESAYRVTSNENVAHFISLASLLNKNDDITRYLTEGAEISQHLDTTIITIIITRNSIERNRWEREIICRFDRRDVASTTMRLRMIIS